MNAKPTLTANEARVLYAIALAQQVTKPTTATLAVVTGLTEGETRDALRQLTTMGLVDGPAIEALS
jgi:hypothetical protein